jgi:hypothetical protein
MRKVNCCYQVKSKNNDPYHTRQTHILWIKRIFDLILHTDPETGRHLTSIPYIHLSFIKIVILVMQSVIINNPFTLAQYICELI